MPFFTVHLNFFVIDCDLWHFFFSNSQSQYLLENAPYIPFTMSLSFSFYTLQTDIPSGLLPDPCFIGGAEIVIK